MIHLQYLVNFLISHDINFTPNFFFHFIYIFVNHFKNFKRMLELFFQFLKIRMNFGFEIIFNLNRVLLRVSKFDIDQFLQKS